MFVKLQNSKNKHASLKLTPNLYKSKDVNFFYVSLPYFVTTLMKIISYILV